MEKHIAFDRHARRRMRWRRISEAEVEEVLRQPDRLEQTEHGRANAFKQVGNRYLKVTFRELGAEILEISTVDKTD
jgi:hypothetical protein